MFAEIATGRSHQCLDHVLTAPLTGHAFRGILVTDGFGAYASWQRKHGGNRMAGMCLFMVILSCFCYLCSIQTSELSSEGGSWVCKDWFCPFLKKTGAEGYRRRKDSPSPLCLTNRILRDSDDRKHCKTRRIF